MSSDHYKRFKNLTYSGFRNLATDVSLSPYEKIGFPDSYRHGKEAAIFDDIRGKLSKLDERSLTVLDIGPGCTDIPRRVIDLCIAHDHTLLLIDSPEMLGLLPNHPHIGKHAGRFPEECAAIMDEYSSAVDVLLVYSVFHYIFAEGNIFHFLDACLHLLAPGGQMLIGDIPNTSKRKRFFASENGVRFHKAFMQTEDVPEVHFNRLEPDEIDDAVLTSVVLRSRSAGFDAYIVPQPTTLPMSNRREDILIYRP